jgi:uncharacterized protein
VGLTAEPRRPTSTSKPHSKAASCCLNEDLKLPYIPALVAQKVGGYEKGELAAGHTLDFYSEEYARLQEQLADAAAKSSLPKEQSGQGDLNELLLTLRTAS